MTAARDTAAHEPLGAHSEFPKSPLLLQMLGIIKRFGAATALQNVSLEVRQGEIHALLGENGAGKSTLMHILSGLFPPDSGSLVLNGAPVRFASPRAARAAGIAMVHQHFTLVPAFTVAENLALDMPQVSFPFGRFSAKQVAASALDYAESLGWSLPADSRVATLPVGTQQRIEIVKALITQAPVLIFDEPTAVLAGDEVEELFSVLRRLRNEGRTIILIAHKLAEILAVSDRVTVLRRGMNVVTTKTSDTTAEQLAEWMIEGTGTDKAIRNHEPHEKEQKKHRENNAEHQKESALAVKKVSVKGERGETAIREIDFEVGAGEIFGIGGVDGNGQTELAEALAGLRKFQNGAMLWQGTAFRVGIAPKIGYIPQDRRRVGLATTLSIRENLLLEAVQSKAYRRGFLLKRKALDELAKRLVSEFDVRTSDAKLPASSLSGGNQQKIVAARALQSEPELIVAVNPTRGLDIGATRFVHEQLRAAKARGAAIVLISTDWDELAVLADRAAILSGGTLTAYDLNQQNNTELGLLLGGAAIP